MPIAQLRKCSDKLIPACHEPSLSHFPTLRLPLVLLEMPVLTSAINRPKGNYNSL